MKVLFFASLREQLNTDQINLASISDIDCVADLLQHLKSRGELWQSALSNPKLIISVNQEIANQQTPLSPDDEVAFFPPVTGG